MKQGQRFFMVEVEGQEPSFYGGLSEIAKLYNLNYYSVAKEIREGKKTYIKDNVTIKTVFFRIKK